MDTDLKLADALTWIVSTKAAEWLFAKVSVKLQI